MSTSRAWRAEGSRPRPARAQGDAHGLEGHVAGQLGRVRLRRGDVGAGAIGPADEAVLRAGGFEHAAGAGVGAGDAQIQAHVFPGGQRVGAGDGAGGALRVVGHAGDLVQVEGGGAHGATLSETARRFNTSGPRAGQFLGAHAPRGIRPG